VTQRGQRVGGEPGEQAVEASRQVGLVGGDLVHQPPALGERGAHRLAGEDQVARARRTDGAGEARGAADVGQDAEGDLGQAEYAVGGRQAQVAGERQLERHAHAGTVQHRHRRAMHALEAIEDRLQVAVQVRERRAAALLEDLEQEPVVDAAREHRAAAAQHQDARRAVVAHGVEGLGERAHGGGVEGVALLRTVEPYGGDRAVALDGDG